jgi:hypothetical protein
MPDLPFTSAGSCRSTTRVRSARTAVRVVLAAVAVAGTQMWGAGPASADSGEATLRFTCTVASFPGQSVTARLRWTVPDSVIVHQPTPAVPIEVTTTLGAIVTDGAGMIGVSSAQGRVDASGVVAAPEGSVRVDVPLTVPHTEVPESGPMSIRATGTIPGRVFHRPGPATVTIGDVFAVGVDLKNADGDTVWHLDASCVLDPGQNTVLSQFQIMTAERSLTSGPAGSFGTGTPPSATPGPNAPRFPPVGSPGSSPGVPEAPQPAGGGDPREATAGAVSPTAAVMATGWTVGWLLAGVTLVVVAGCSWWLVRRRRG